MPKKAKEMSPLEVKRLIKPGHYAVGGVSGLLLKVRSETQRSWILRYVTGEVLTSSTGKPYLKRRDFGLGGYPDVTLAGARDKARQVKEQIAQGDDPIDEKKTIKQSRLKELNRRATFSEVAHKAHQVKIQEFKNPKHAAQWISTLETYAFPVIADLPIDDIEAADVLKVLQPIWSDKTETATRVRQRIASVFDHASASGLRTKPNPAAWRGCLEPLLPAPEKLKKRLGKSGKHHPALPYMEVPTFFADLRQREGAGARALEFAILTAARSGEIRGAKWSEIDFDAKTWHLTAERMKADKAHTVPLSDSAISLLKSLPQDNELIFTYKGEELSLAAMASAIKRMNMPDIKYLDPKSGRAIVPHGFRSSFKDWSRRDTARLLKSGDTSSFPDEWSELALAHVNSDATRAAYVRNELLEERAEMMQGWANFCEGDKVGNVVSLRVQR